MTQITLAVAMLARCIERRFWNIRMLAFLMFVVTGGCEGQTLVPATGTVKYKNGTPVSAGLIIFEPSSHKISARGELKADGTFQLGTNTNNDGAMEGEYQVLIAPPPLPEEGKRLRSPIPAKYQSLETTPLKFRVTRDASKNNFAIEIE